MDSMRKREALLILGIDDPNPSLNAIASTYRRLALEIHPDRNPKDITAAHERFLRLTRARDALLKTGPGVSFPVDLQWDYDFAVRGCLCEKCVKIRTNGGIECGLKFGEVGHIHDWEAIDDYMQEGCLTSDEHDEEAVLEDESQTGDVDPTADGDVDMFSSDDESDVPVLGEIRSFGGRDELAREIRRTPEPYTMDVIRDIIAKPFYKNCPTRHLDDDGNTALHYACYFGRLGIVALLLETFSPKTILPALNNAGKTPADVAKNFSTIRILVEFKEKLPQNGRDVKLYSVEIDAKLQQMKIC